MTFAVQPRCDGFDAEAPTAFHSLEIEAKDKTDHFGLDQIDLEALFDPCSTVVDDDGLVSEGCACAVPEPLPGVFLHRSQNVLRVLTRLMFVEQSDDLAHQRLRRIGIVTERLGDGDDRYAMLQQLPQIQLELEALAEEAAERVHDDGIDSV